MRNIKFTIAYDGTDFSGWQAQPGQSTVQGALTDVLEKLTQRRLTICAAGRTDAGVHAAGQVVNFRTQSPLATEEFLRAFNALLPPSIRVNAAEEVSPDFHSRWDALAKTYRYRIFRGRVVPPFLWRYVQHDSSELNFEAMAEAARHFVGEHDFTSFAASTGSEEDDRDRTTIRTIYRSELLRAQDADSHNAGGMGLRGSREIIHAPHGEEDGRNAGRRRPRETRCGRFAGTVCAARSLEIRRDDAAARPMPENVEYPDPANSLTSSEQH